MFHKPIENHDGEFNWLKRAEELSSAIRAVGQRVSALQDSVINTNSNFGGRIGAIEARNEVQDAKMESIKEAVTELKGEIRASQAEQKDSIAALRTEQKESMDALREDSQQSMSKLEQKFQAILDAVTPMKHEIEDVEVLKKEVAEIKAKPGKTWEGIKENGLNWALRVVFVIVIVALGLKEFL